MNSSAGSGVMVASPDGVAPVQLEEFTYDDATPKGDLSPISPSQQRLGGETELARVTATYFGETMAFGLPCTNDDSGRECYSCGHASISNSGQVAPPSCDVRLQYKARSEG